MTAVPPIGVALGPEAAGRLVDLCDDEALRGGSPLPFSCRSARCATCLVEVVTGAERLAPPAPDEHETLRLHGAADSQRLACQVSVRPGPGLVVLRVVGGRARLV